MITRVHENHSFGLRERQYRSNYRRSGFSILELLLALGITAVMAGSVYMVYANAVRLEARSRELNDMTFRSYMIFKIIEDDLLHSVNYRFRAIDGNGEVPAFVGEKDSFVFAAETPLGLRWVGYFLEDPEDGVIRKTTIGQRYSKNQAQILEENITAHKTRSLIRQQSLFDTVSPGESRMENRETVISALNSGDISFRYGRSEKNTELVWKDQWNDLNSPSAIRVDVRFSKGPSAPGMQYSKVIVLPAGF